MSGSKSSAWGGGLTAGDLESLRKAQVSDGVVRYLQGRAAVEQQLGAYPYVYGYSYAYRPLYSRYSPVYLGGGAHHSSGYHHSRHH